MLVKCHVSINKILFILIYIAISHYDMQHYIKKD
jgi:hypothetical protein